MAMTMTEFLTLAEADINSIWHEDEERYPEQYSRFMNIVNLNELYLREGKMAGFGSFREIPEDGDVTYENAIPPVTKRYDLVKRGLGYKITEKLWKFDKYGEVKKFERDLKTADQDDTESFMFGIFNNATATTVATGFDSLALASTAHTRLDGGATQANRPTVLTALSLTSLQDAIIAMRNATDDRGRPIKNDPAKLLIALELEMVAEEILGSAMRPDTANNATNAVRKYGVAAESSPYLTSATFAALLGKKHDIKAIWNQRPMQKSEVVFDSDTIKRKSTKWLGRGFGHWYGFHLLNS
jgi:hypothetical protein